MQFKLQSNPFLNWLPCFIHCNLNYVVSFYRKFLSTQSAVHEWTLRVNCSVNSTGLNPLSNSTLKKTYPMQCFIVWPSGAMGCISDPHSPYTVLLVQPSVFTLRQHVNFSPHCLPHSFTAHFTSKSKSRVEKQKHTIAQHVIVFGTRSWLIYSRTPFCRYQPTKVMGRIFISARKK